MNYSFLEEQKESIISNDLIKNEDNELDEGLKDVFRKVTKAVKDASPISTLRYAFGSDDASVIENEIYKNAKQLNSILQSNEETSKLITDALSNYYHITDKIARIARICNKIIENREDKQLFAEGVREIAKAINEIEHMGGMHGAKDVSDLTTFYKNAMNDIMNGMGKSQFKKVQSVLASLKDNVKTLLKKNNSLSQRGNGIDNSQNFDSSFDSIESDSPLDYNSDDSSNTPVNNGVLNNDVSGQVQQSTQQATGSRSKLATTGGSSDGEQAQQGKPRSTGSRSKLATTGGSSDGEQAQQGKPRSTGSRSKLATTGGSNDGEQAQQNKKKNVDPYAQTGQLKAINQDDSENNTSRKSTKIKSVSSDDSENNTSRKSTKIKSVSSDVEDGNATQTRDSSKDTQGLSGANKKNGNDVFKNKGNGEENNKETIKQGTLNKGDNSNNDVKQPNRDNKTQENPEKNKKPSKQTSVTKDKKSGDSGKLINWLKEHPMLIVAEEK